MFCFLAREIYLHILVVSRDDVLCIKEINVYSTFSPFKELLCLCYCNQSMMIGENEKTVNISKWLRVLVVYKFE